MESKFDLAAARHHADTGGLMKTTKWLHAALDEIKRQAARIEELEGQYEAVTMCFNCGKRAWEVGADEDADLGAIRFDGGSPGSRYEPEEPAVAYFVCNECLKAEGKIGGVDKERLSPITSHNIFIR